jgi:type II secretory pathway component GspD/PulD (secretin)
MRSIAIALLLISLWVPAAHAAEVVHIYKVQHRSAEELLPLVRTAMADGGSAEADGGSNTLVLAGSREGVAAALRLLSKVDRSPRSVVLRYASRGLRELEGQGVHVNWSGTVGALRVGSVAFPGGGSGMRIQAAGNAGTREGDLAGEVRLLEGGSAQITTGYAVPFTTGRARAQAKGPVVKESTTFVSGESGFEAQARVLDDGRIELELRAMDSRLRSGARLASSSSVTTLLLEPGKTVALGGLSQDANHESARLAADSASSQRADETLLLVTATVE